MSRTLSPRWSVTLPGRFVTAGREMDQMFEHLFGNGNGNGGTESMAIAPASLWEEENRWCLEIDLPGVQRDDIDITVEKNALRLTAERRGPQEERAYHHHERAYGQIQRMFMLPEAIDAEQIEAELACGVLRLSLAKKPELQPKKIQVKSN
jgi:HSP20 family protein